MRGDDPPPPRRASWYAGSLGRALRDSRPGAGGGASADAFLADAADALVEVEYFRESYFPYCGAEIKDYFNELRRRVDPDLVFCHHRSDEHQDHRFVGQLVWNTFRDSLHRRVRDPEVRRRPWASELVRGSPGRIAETKIELIVEHFGTQADKYWFRPETLSAIIALRGVEAGSANAEAFHVRKLVI